MAWQPQRFLLLAVEVILALLLWEGLVLLLQIPSYLFPTASSVALAILDPRFQWPQHFLTTLYEALGGFLLAIVLGIGAAIAIVWSERLERLLLPWMVFLNTVPKIAAAPLILIWLPFGKFGLLPNIVIAFLITFFPILIDTMTGLREVEPDMMDLIRSLKATKWQVFRLIRLPNALPFIFSALKVSATLAVTGAVVAEFIVSEFGLAALIIQTQVTLETQVAFGSLLFIAAMGMGLFGLIGLIQRRVMPWQE